VYAGEEIGYFIHSFFFGVGCGLGAQGGGIVRQVGHAHVSGTICC